MSQYECPYCREGLYAGDAYYLVTWCSGRGAEDYEELDSFFKSLYNNSDNRKKERENRTWKNFLHEKFLFLDTDIILSREETARLKKYILDKQYVNMSQIDHLWEQRTVANFLDEDKNETIPMTPTTIQEEKTVYHYVTKNNQEEFDYQGDIAYGAINHIIARVRRVCPTCYNLIPDDLYKYPTIKVYFVAMPKSGKTSMLYSFFLNGSEFNRVNNQYMKWESIQDGNVDPYFREFQNKMQDYQMDKVQIERTKANFIPPLLIKVTYMEKGKTEHVILALYDNGGELFVGDENKIAKEHASVFHQRIKGMDVLLCIIDSEMSELSTDGSSIMIDEQSRKIIRENYKVHSSIEQRNLEQNHLELEYTIEEMVKEIIGFHDCSANMQENIDRTCVDKHLKSMKDSASEILNNLQRRLGSREEMNEIIKDKLIVFAITKTDLLVNSEIFTEEERELFLDESIDYFSVEAKERRALRHFKIDEWQRDGYLVKFDYDNRRVHYHSVAAYIHSRRNVVPIRIEEPVVGIVENYFSM